MNAKKETKDLAHLKRVSNLLIESRIFTVACLARTINRCRSHTSQVLYGHKRALRTRIAIAKAFGVPLKEIWPDMQEGK